MKETYQIIFSMQVRHSFFEEDKCNCLSFVPSAAGGELLNKYGFKMSVNKNGFNLFCNSSAPLPDFLNYITAVNGVDYFDFAILNSNPSFFIFTEMPLQQLVQFEYSSTSAITDANNGVATLQPVLNTQTTAGVFGTLRIYFSSLISAAANTIASVFQIAFEARATQWQYYFINRNALALENCEINGKPSVQFQGPTKTVMENGEQALLFSSAKQLLPLNEVPRCKFDLVNQNQNASGKARSPKIIFKGLPNADPDRLNVDNENGTNVAISKMYVYL